MVLHLLPTVTAIFNRAFCLLTHQPLNLRIFPPTKTECLSLPRYAQSTPPRNLRGFLSLKGSWVPLLLLTAGLVPLVPLFHSHPARSSSIRFPFTLPPLRQVPLLTAYPWS